MVMMLLAVHVTVFAFLLCGGPDAGDLDGKMQFLACHGMVEIQPDGLHTDLIDTGMHRMIIFVVQFQHGADFEGYILRELLARHIHVGIIVRFAVAIRGATTTSLPSPMDMPYQFPLQARDDVAVALQEFDRAVLGSSRRLFRRQP